MLSVVASLEFGTMTVCYNIFVCGNVVMMVVLVLDEPWYNLYVIVRSGGYHLNHLIENAFDTEAVAQMALGNRRPNDGKGAKSSGMDRRILFY